MERSAAPGGRRNAGADAARDGGDAGGVERRASPRALVRGPALGRLFDPGLDLLSRPTVRPGPVARAGHVSTGRGPGRRAPARSRRAGLAPAWPGRSSCRSHTWSSARSASISTAGVQGIASRRDWRAHSPAHRRKPAVHGERGRFARGARRGAPGRRTVAAHRGVGRGGRRCAGERRPDDRTGDRSPGSAGATRDRGRQCRRHGVLDRGGGGGGRRGPDSRRRGVCAIGPARSVPGAEGADAVARWNGGGTLWIHPRAVPGSRLRPDRRGATGAMASADR